MIMRKTGLGGRPPFNPPPRSKLREHCCDDNPMSLTLPIEDGANELLSRSPLALLIAMLLDQQVSLEKAFSSPYQLAQRLGHEPTAAELADYDPEALAAVFSDRPALHRFPRAMAARVQELARVIAERYDGDGAQVWATAATGAELADGVRPDGWREAAGRFGEEGSRWSVADITDAASLAAVREHKRQVKAAAKAHG